MSKKSDDKDEVSKKVKNDDDEDEEPEPEEDEEEDEEDEDVEDVEEDDDVDEAEEDEDAEEDEEAEEAEEEEEVEDSKKKKKRTKKKNVDDDEEEEDEEDEDEEEEDEDEDDDDEEADEVEEEKQHELPPELLLDASVLSDDVVRQKFDDTFQQQILDRHHPELVQVPWQDAQQLVRRTHATVPFLTKYERTRVLGERTEQLNRGATPLIALQQDDGVLLQDHYEIACAELVQKKLPFLIKRPLPNGEAEYWRLCDLQQL